MLKIAAIGNDFIHVKHFVEYKFKDKIAKVNNVTGVYTLKNGDVIYPCYNEAERSRYLAMEYDAFVIAPGYTSLMDTIRYRAER